MKRYFYLSSRCLRYALFIFININALASHRVHAQTSNGFIIDAQGDTVQGMLQVENDFQNNRKILFRRANEQTFQSYSPETLKAYGIPGSIYYEAKEVQYGPLPNPSDMATANARETHQEIFFLQVLADGQARLFTFLDAQLNQRYLIQKDGGELYELKKEYLLKETTRGGNRVTGYVEKKTHLGILSYLFNDCASLSGKIQDVELNDASLTHITNLYNTCIDPFSNPVSYRTEPKVLLRKSVIAGISMSNYDFKDGELRHAYLTEPAPSPNVNPTLGFNLEVKFPRGSRILSIYSGLIYYRNKYNTTYSKTVPISTDWNYTTVLDYHYIKWPLLIKATFNTGRLKPYLLGGLQTNFVISYTNKMTLEKVYPDRTETEEYMALEDNAGQDGTRNVEAFGLSGGIGFEYGLSDKTGLFLESRYESGPAPSALLGIKSKHTAVIITGGFYF